MVWFNSTLFSQNHLRKPDKSVSNLTKPELPLEDKIIQLNSLQPNFCQTKTHDMKTHLVSLVFLLIPFFSQSQNWNPDQASDSYSTPENPYYWKNKLPYPGYWQQDVHYRISAQLDDNTDIITGTLRLTYSNNSPDTLFFVFFHLYQNAFQPGSYYENLITNRERKPFFGKYESQGLGTMIESLSVSDGSGSYDPELIYDNTIVKVLLKNPLLPGNKIDFYAAFKTYYDNGSIRRRMKIFNSYGFKHYDGVHWYPRISVYDHKFGWTTDQHLGHEFYGDFGTYEVELWLPDHYILDATGILQNREEVLPDSLRKMLDIRNFKDKPWGEAPSTPIIPSGKFKTWKFYAENVHDFAFTADPTYRIGEAYWEDVQCIALVQEPHASGWQNAAEYTARIIEVFSKDIGRYIYPKMIVADARDGMEYPMLTLDGGRDPSYRGLFVHEVGHNWFFGMVGNNETYRAFLDEGFTQWLTAHGLERIDGKMGEPKVYNNKYQQKFKSEVDARTYEVYWGYYRDAIRGNDGFLNTHSDMFYTKTKVNGTNYSQVYRKTATMLYNLQYVLGDSLFFHAMQFYFDRWKVAHPYPEDFRQAIIDYTKADLNWFFDQWLETDKRIDYKVSTIRKTKETDTYTIRFKRKERMQMPIDFSVFAKDGSKHDFLIPNTWFVKETHATVLPKWFGWDVLNPVYTATVTIPSGIDYVVIDTSQRLADINMLNNTTWFPSTLKFDSRINNIPDRMHYEMLVRPDIWYNSYDGFKAGFHLEGSYMNYLHQFNFDTWVNTGLVQGKLDPSADVTQFDPLSIRLSYRTPLQSLVRNSWVDFSMKLLDGLNEYKGFIEFKDLRQRASLRTGFKSMHRPNTNDLAYLLFPDQWQSGVYNNYLFAEVNCPYEVGKLSNTFSLNIQSSSLFSDYDFAKISLTHISRTSFSKFDFHLRLFGQYATGSLIPHESSLFLAGANPEEMMDEKFVRSRGFYPTQWLGYSARTNHFQYGGGLNLRGYAGYLAAEFNNGEIKYLYKGISGAAINAELDFNRFIRLQPAFTRHWLKANIYLFADGGFINANRTDEKFYTGTFRADAGIGTAFTIKKFGPCEKINPFTIRFDMPLLLNKPPYAENDYFKFRWILAVSRAF